MTNNFLFIDVNGSLIPIKNHLIPQNYKFHKEFMKAYRYSCDSKDRNLSKKQFEKTLREFPPLFDPWAVRAHNLLAKRGEAKVIIVTKWKDYVSIEFLKNLFEKQGLEFEYADHPKCSNVKEKRWENIALYMDEYISENSRALIIEDSDISGMYGHYILKDNKKMKTDGVKKHKKPVFHDDKQVGFGRVGSNGKIEKSKQWKWLKIDRNNGMTCSQFKIGAEFFGIDWVRMIEDSGSEAFFWYDQ